MAALEKRGRVPKYMEVGHTEDAAARSRSTSSLQRRQSQATMSAVGKDRIAEEMRRRHLHAAGRAMY